MTKKFFLMLAILVCTLPTMAQSIIYDQTSSNGVRTLICSGVNTGVSGNVDVNIGLAGFYYNGIIQYSLAVVVGSGSSITIPTGSHCILTLSSGKSYELETVSGGTAVLQDMEVNMDRVYQSYQRFAYYNIKKSEIKKLKKGVARLDIEMSPRTYSVTFGSDVLGSLFINSREIIDQAFGK